MPVLHAVVESGNLGLNPAVVDLSVEVIRKRPSRSAHVEKVMQRVVGAATAGRTSSLASNRSQLVWFDSFVDSFAGRLCEASGNVVRRLRHNPNTQETP